MVSFYYSHDMRLTFSGGFFILFCFVFLINRALVVVIKLDISNISFSLYPFLYVVMGGSHQASVLTSLLVCRISPLSLLCLSHSSGLWAVSIPPKNINSEIQGKSED